jgi:quercetin dioxygenase-like cupin family protein
MKMLQVAIVSGLIALAGPTSAQGMDDTMLGPQDVKWGLKRAYSTATPGKTACSCFGSSSPRAMPFPPHSHPKPEIVTVISGTFTLGMGKVADKSSAKPLPAGSFFAFAPGMEHYAFTDEETVVQINSTGPWGISYVNPKDDPRQKTQ